MKTKQIRLLVTILTITTVITIGINSATAQRRSTGSTNMEAREQKNSAQSKVDSNNTRTSTINESTNTRNRQATSTRQDTNVRRETNNRPVSTRSNSNTQRKDNVAPQVNKNQIKNSSTVKKGSENNTNRRNNNISINTRKNEYSRNVNNPEARRNTENARRIYRLDENDSRYKPNNNFKGNNRYWSYNDRPGDMNYNHNDRNFYRNYDYRNYSHWNRQWETYRWNLYSWRDYYRAYNPRSFQFHRYYVHHPIYGHVIRRFTVRPIIFNHNNIRYYCYDGHFFRQIRGVGYVLVDIPFGITFNVLPHNYERVHINGDLYFRIGNMFFERTNFGFILIHYPERYYSLDDSFINEGYYFDDDIYW
ncbi:MAG: hypothetical protein LBV47_09345 [Bacteroidales bacterium]|jgi:hypothetical protein|nr:hypothetical protein [Bacteroidales bacterium]